MKLKSDIIDNRIRLRKLFPLNLEYGLKRLLRSYERYFTGEYRRIWEEAREEKSIRFFENKSVGSIVQDILSTVVARAITNTEDMLRNLYLAAGIVGFETVLEGVAKDRVLRFVELEWQKRGASLITKINNEQREVLQFVLNYYMTAEPVSPYDLSRKLRPFIGLTEPQAQRLQKLAEELSKEMSPAQVQKALEKYSQQMIRYRAKVIARTELNYAYNHGAIANMNDITAGADIKVKKVWLTTEDDRLCEECMAMDGKEADLNGSFGEVDAPPLHPNSYDKDTEIYTDKGWKKVSELKVGDKCLSLNPKTFDLE